MAAHQHACQMCHPSLHVQGGAGAGAKVEVQAVSSERCERKTMGGQKHVPMAAGQGQPELEA